MKKSITISPISSVILAGIIAFVMNSVWMNYEKHHAHSPEEFTGIQLASTNFPHLAAAHISANLMGDENADPMGTVELVLEDQAVRLKAKSFSPWMISAVEVSYGYESTENGTNAIFREELNEYESSHDLVLPVMGETNCKGYHIVVELTSEDGSINTEQVVMATGTATDGFSILRLCTNGGQSSGGSAELTAMAY